MLLPCRKEQNTGLLFFLLSFYSFVVAVVMWRVADCVRQRMERDESVAELAVTSNCWILFWSAALQRKFSLPAAFDHLDTNGRSREATETRVEARDFAETRLLLARFVRVTPMMVGCNVGCC